jgi:hypothetical protein
MRGGQEAVSTSGLRYNLKLSMLPSYFLSSIPGFRKKTAPSSEAALTQRSDNHHSDSQRRTMSHLEKSFSPSKGVSNTSQLLPSVSDSRLMKSKQNATNTKIRKIIVTNPSSASTTKTYEGGNIVKINVTNKLNGGSGASQKTLGSPDLKAPLSGRAKPVRGSETASTGFPDTTSQGFYYQNPARASTTTSKVQHNSVGNYSPTGQNTDSTCTTLTTPPSSSRSTGKQTASSPRASAGLLNKMGLSSPSKSTAASSANTGVVAHPHDAHRSGSYAPTVNAARNSYSSSGHSAGTVVHTGGATSSTPYGFSSASAAAKTNSSILPALPIAVPSSSSTTAAATGAGNKTKPLCCDKCDGKHETDSCPHYKKKREDHPDAQRNGKQMGGVSSLPGNTLYAARVVRQPGDGSCLFHSMSYGLQDKSNAAKLRAEICQFIVSHPDLKISDTPLQDWVRWDANSSVTEYARRMSRGSWGGGIEMACVSQVTFAQAVLDVVPQIYGVYVSAPHRARHCT